MLLDGLGECFGELAGFWGVWRSRGFQEAPGAPALVPPASSGAASSGDAGRCRGAPSGVIRDLNAR